MSALQITCSDDILPYGSRTPERRDVRLPTRLDRYASRAIRTQLVASMIGGYRILRPRLSACRKLYCDIDSTVNNHAERIRRWTTGNPPTISPEAFTTREVLKDSVAFNSVEWLCRIRHAGWKIHWLSSRPAHLWEATEQWLLLHAFPVDSLLLVPSMEHKLRHLALREVGLFVDDFSYGHETADVRIRTDVIAQLQRMRIPFAVFGGDWASIFKAMERARADSAEEVLP